MNMRGQKHYIMAGMAYNMMWVNTDQGGTLQDTLLKRIAEEELQAVEEARQEFVCSRVKDGTVVATFDSLADARALVEKNIRAKKARLQVMDSSTGELIAFKEEGV